MNFKRLIENIDRLKYIRSTDLLSRISKNQKYWHFEWNGYLMGIEETVLCIVECLSSNPGLYQIDASAILSGVTIKNVSMTHSEKWGLQMSTTFYLKLIKLYHLNWKMKLTMLYIKIFPKDDFFLRIG